MAILTSLRSTIADALLVRIATITEIKYANFDTVRLHASDFQDSEIPAVQLIDLDGTGEHITKLEKFTWPIAIEVVMGTTVTGGQVTQKSLWNMMYTIKRAIFAVPKLGITQIEHLRTIGESTDLHLLSPFYLGRIEIAAVFDQALVDEC